MLPSVFVAKVEEAGLKWKKVPNINALDVFIGRDQRRFTVGDLSEVPEDKVNSLIERWKTSIKSYQDFDSLPEKGPTS
jgi:hypothetical protein